VFSDICIPLVIRCLRAPLLYTEGACSLVRPYQPCLVVWPPPCTGGKRPTAVCLELDSEDGGKRSGRGHSGDPLVHGESPSLVLVINDTKLLMLL
jgi:hypothetical protein